jgi:hypothetical protein
MFDEVHKSCSCQQHMCLSQTQMGRGGGGDLLGKKNNVAKVYECLKGRMWRHLLESTTIWVGVMIHYVCHKPQECPYQLARSLWWGDIKASLSMFCEAYNSNKAPI